MDWQRNIIIAAILAVLFTLAIRWNTFQEQHPVVTEQMPQTETAIKTSDIPDAITLPAISEQKPATETASRNIINVKTDSLWVEIDPIGGDIVKVALPRHAANLSTPDIPFVLIDNGASHTYVAQSGLVGPNGTDTAQGRPLYTVAKNEYFLDEGQNTLVVDLTLEQYQVNITKRYTFTRGQYLVAVEYLIDNQSSNKWTGNFYAQIKRDNKEFAKANALSMNPFLGAAITTPDEKYKKFTFEDLDDVKEFKATVEGGWVSLVQHYFISAWIPDSHVTNNYHLRKLGDKNLYLFGFTSNAIEIAPNSKAAIKANFYAGPKDTESLKSISPHLDLTVDYGWLWMVGEPLFWLLKFIHGFVGNWGVAIIGLTVAVKLLFFKLSATSYKSMAKMRKLAPKMAELKERYGDDRQKMSQETMKLYQTEKVNPLGGCLPMLIQMPVFLALYWVLMESVELRHAPFILWINDLSVQDPYYVLPIIYGITMYFMQKLNPQPTDPMQARVMQMLPIVFTFMFLWFPAGLVLYWVTNNTLSMLQQYVITREIDKADSKS
ncbi:MAG: membrane protein insertase YidC [Pseudomonadota bacterium]